MENAECRMKKAKQMKTRTIVPLAVALLLSALNSQLSTVVAQGSLTPPGAPSATMKSLAQIEPRTPISSAPFTIAVSGSYYLTTNMTVSSGNAITIATNGVTVDLNGFTIASTAASAAGTAISLASALSDITIVNGHIRSGVTNNGSGVYSGSGFGYGIYYSGTQPVNMVVSKLSVADVLYDGIHLATGYATVVENCTVTTAGSKGIVAATIKGSVATDCGQSAISGDQVTDCRGYCTGSSYGILTTSAQNCYGISINGNGLRALTAQNCYGQSTGGIGLFVYSNAQNCYGQSSSSTGLYASDSAIGCSGSSTSGTGLWAYIANSCRGTSTSGTAQNITYKYNMP